MKYRIKQISKHHFIVQRNMLNLINKPDINFYSTLNRLGEIHKLFRNKKWFELNFNYNIKRLKHIETQAYFYCIEDARGFIKECKTEYPKYHKK
jgi:hypothetical protein